MRHLSTFLVSKKAGLMSLSASRSSLCKDCKNSWNNSTCNQPQSSLDTRGKQDAYYRLTSIIIYAVVDNIIHIGLIFLHNYQHSE